ncbi:MAG: URC4/urg3 family protein [Leptolyngbyaceae cyanobacterium MO_188.B28]|nr:URC4/urg3 family protein [Leptolyngbyaceae cyanobacterium MO_188.B28]
MLNAATQVIEYLRTPAAIRDRCNQLFALACDDQLEHFRCCLNRLETTADFVIQVMREQYPTLEIPFHSRWRHFEVDGASRVSQLTSLLGQGFPLEMAKLKIDLAVTSVLLDAGAGNQWRYIEPGTGRVFRRSEGLAIASFHLFQQGAFSSDPDRPWQADAEGLQQLTAAQLAKGLQVNSGNPLVGLEGRLKLLQQLGKTLLSHPDFFGSETPRPGNLVPYLITLSQAGRLPASQILRTLLEGFGDIWPGRVAIAEVNLGDVWRHPQLPDTDLGSQLVPFHKLSQWLTYSFLEPLQEVGLEITHLDALTGLAEYRNGGLCVDCGLLEAKHGRVTRDRHRPDSSVIVEWRALTVILLDQIAACVRQKLNLNATDLPLAKILQGGSWTAGRRIAGQLRNGLPPIQIDSDGTVF